jgi:hypothetical protein
MLKVLTWSKRSRGAAPAVGCPLGLEQRCVYAFAVLDPAVLGCVPRPLLRLDEEDRLHDWDGRPAAEWEGGQALWYWHGVRMTEHQGKRPDLVTPRRIAGWVNTERRRVAIERIGLEAFLRGLEAEIVQQDDYGRLWRHVNRSAESRTSQGS